MIFSSQLQLKNQHTFRGDWDNTGFFAPKIQASIISFLYFGLIFGRGCRWFVRRDSMRATVQGGARGAAEQCLKNYLSLKNIYLENINGGE